MFKHDFLEKKILTRIDSDQGRLYKRETEMSPFNYIHYPSVTTVLKEYYDSSWLEKWKNKVGEDKANRISTQARYRGTEVHSVYERFLLNENYIKGTIPVNLEEFYKIEPILKEKIDIVYGLELPLYSDILKVAGTTDAVTTWGGKLSVLDFKTSKRKRRRSDIESYFVQATIYSMMIEELYNLPIEQIVIIINVDGSDPLIFEEDSNSFRDKAKEIVEFYYDKSSRVLDCSE